MLLVLSQKYFQILLKSMLQNILKKRNNKQLHLSLRLPKLKSSQLLKTPKKQTQKRKVPQRQIPKLPLQSQELQPKLHHLLPQNLEPLKLLPHHPLNPEPLKLLLHHLQNLLERFLPLPQRKNDEKDV